MQTTRRSLALGAFATTALTALAGTLAPGVALADSFSVSGKHGPYLRQVGGRHGGFTTANSTALGLQDAINLGRYQAARLRMPQTEALVGQLMAKLDAQWPYEKGPPLEVQILGLDYYNAYSLADGSIVVAFGLLDTAKSDDEVAFVLAHELGHVRLGHFSQRPAADTESRREQLASSMGQMFTVAQQIPLSGAAGSVLSAATQAGASNDLIHFMANVMVEPPHTRDQEDQADCIGYDISQAGGYAPDAASARVFDTVQADQTQRAQTIDGLNKQLNTQLSQAITPSAAESFLSGGASTTGLIESAGRFALGLAAANSGGHAEPQHRPPEERKKGLAQYSAEAYPEGAPLRDEQTSWLSQVRATREFAQGKLAVRAVTNAQLARAKGDYAGASAAMAQARATMFGHAPLVLNEAARLAADKGDGREAERLFNEADASQDQTVDGMVDHVRFLYQSQQYDRARQVVNAGVQRFNDQKPFIALAIGIARAQGQEQEMEGYLATCEGFHNDALARDCRLAAGHSAEAPHHDGPHLPGGLPFGIPHF